MKKLAAKKNVDKHLQIEHNSTKTGEEWNALEIRRKIPASPNRTTEP